MNGLRVEIQKDYQNFKMSIWVFHNIGRGNKIFFYNENGEFKEQEVNTHEGMSINSEIKPLIVLPLLGLGDDIIEEMVRAFQGKSGEELKQDIAKQTLAFEVQSKELEYHKEINTKLIDAVIHKLFNK